MAPLIGRFIEKFGERLALIIEYFGLMVIFLLYAGLYYFDWSYLVASVLFIADHMFFGLAFAMKTYFQKIPAHTFIGDHTKTAIGTKLNSGSVIGLGSMIATYGFPPKLINPFTWYINGEKRKVILDKFLKTTYHKNSFCVWHNINICIHRIIFSPAKL